jgi:putative ABC transport system substrate-binding protein
LFLTVGNDTSLRAKKAVEGTDIPVLVASFHRPAETGLVKSLVMPGGNVTGVAGLDRTEKALEWLKVLTPGLKKVFLPYNPDDSVSVISLPGLDMAASQPDIEILYQKVHSVEEAIAAIKKLPKDVKALFIIPSPTLNPRNSEINQAAIGRGIATGSHIALEGGIMVTLATDFFLIGKQTSRLAHQIRRGVKPADIPFETSDVFLTINLKTAKRIGIHIPDDIIAQANTIIR